MVAGLVLIYLVLLGLLWRVHRMHPGAVSMRETLRPLPHLIRLLRRLAADPDLPRGVRIRLILLLMYPLSPIDLVPDFVPMPPRSRSTGSWKYTTSPSTARPIHCGSPAGPRTVVDHASKHAQPRST